MAHPRKQVLFVLLSLADLALTCWLLSRSGGELYEANPVARWWLLRHGWAGLACFKVLVVALVLALALLIARSRPRAAGRVLGLGCAVSALVVLYSASLCPAAARSPEERDAEVMREANKDMEEVNRQTRQSHQQHQVFRHLLARLGEDLIAGRCTLGEAAERVAASEHGRNPGWRRALADRWPDRPIGEVFAACVLCHLIVSLEGDLRTAWQVALRLEREFRRTYGSTPPLDHRPSLRKPGTEGEEDSGGGATASKAASVQWESAR